MVENQKAGDKRLKFSIICCDPHKVFGKVNKAEVDTFLELSYFFYDPMDVGNLISGFSAFSKSSLNIWKFLVLVLLKPGFKNFEYYFEHSLTLLFFGIGRKVTFSSPVATAEVFKFVDILSTALSQHHLLGFEIAQLEFHHLHCL